MTARVMAIAQVALIMAGLGEAQYPAIVVPHVTIFNSGAPSPVVQTLAWVLLAGALLVAPSLAYLFWVFKGPRQPTQP
jgi:cytochrome d ubiquinol oxidase subunit II